MEQLVEMRTTPASFGFTVHHARYEMFTEPPSYYAERDRGGFDIYHRPAKLKMDSIEMRASTGAFSTVRKFTNFYAQKGMQAALDEAGKLAKDGNRLVDIYKRDNPLAQIAREESFSMVETALRFAPSVPLNISWEPHDLNVRYEMDRLTFDWRTKIKPEIEYVPGKVECYIKEYAKLEIEYVGDPIYIPPSSDPNYDNGSFSTVA